MATSVDDVASLLRGSPADQANALQALEGTWSAIRDLLATIEELHKRGLSGALRAACDQNNVCNNRPRLWLAVQAVAGKGKVPPQDFLSIFFC
jgi:hypothetical protein